MTSKGKRNRSEEPISKEVEVPTKHGKAEHEVTTNVVGNTKVSLAQPSVYTLNPDFLRAITNMKAEHLRIPDGVIFICTREDKVVDVWKGLIKHGFLSVPVLQKRGSKYYGSVDLLDIVHNVIDTFGKSKLESSEDYWELVRGDEEFQDRFINKIMVYPLSRRNPFHPITKGYSLFAVMELLAREHGLHRVPIIDNYEHRRLIGMITQSHLVKFLFDNLELMGEKKNKPLNLVPEIFKEVASVRDDANAIDSFKIMIEKAISGVAVVDSNGKLTGNISARDLKAISTDGRMFWRLFETNKNFLAKVKQTDKERPSRVVFVKQSDTLETAIKLLAEHQLHHIFLVDEHSKPIGVISLKDILLQIISNN